MTSRLTDCRTDRAPARSDEAEDARVQAFRRWLLAVDFADAPEMLRATRELRKSGVSICAITGPATNGRASK